MQQLIELVPIALFFITFSMKGTVVTLGDWQHQLDGIYSATAVLMAATCVQVILTWLLTRRVEKRLLLMLVVVMATGTLTLALHNKIFIQWKPTLFNWALALVFLVTPLLGERKTLLERTLGAQLQLPGAIWVRLNALWITNFVLAGSLNLFVAYQYSEEAWVSYKLYSAIGFTLLLSVLTALLVAPHLKESPEGDGGHQS